MELRPLGVTCNLQCQYCYQHPQRDAGNVGHSYDMAAMKDAVAAAGGPFTLFGGEPLLLPNADLEELWAWGLARFGHNEVQTNGTLIDDERISMFRRYAVRVGISMDGPEALNDARWYGTLERTRAATARAQTALERLCEEGIPVGLIVTLHSTNASAARLPALMAWVRDLELRGLRSLRLHLLETDTDVVREAYALDEHQNIAAMRALLGLSRELPRLRIEPFADMRRMLLGDDELTSCTWHGCDPYNTAAVQGVEGDGSQSNCGRTNKDGIDFEKAQSMGMERSLALYFTSQDSGGCQGCRFFLMCKGQCPGTALDRDWRNRSEHCAVWKAIYGDLEAHMVAAGEVPLSLSDERPALETRLTDTWLRGGDLGLAGLLDGERKVKVARQEIPCDRSLAGQAPPVLPDFLRVAWTSVRAREVWQPRLERIREAWVRSQWHSVADSVRACALLLGEDAVRLDRDELARRGLVTGELWAGRRNAGPDGRGARRGFAAVVGTAGSVAQFQEAWGVDDHDSIGQLLGYPSCCRQFHSEVRIKQRLMDPTWAIAGESAHEVDSAGRRVIDGAPECNVLWRSLGVRAVPHTSCGFDCEATAALARDIRSAAQDAGVDELAIGWRDEILSWPAEWSALHGIAELNGPVVKVAFRTDVTSGRRVVRFSGTVYPAEGARAIAFPHLAGRRRITSAGAFERGISHARSAAADVR